MFVKMMTYAVETVDMNGDNRYFRMTGPERKIQKSMAKNFLKVGERITEIRWYPNANKLFNRQTNEKKFFAWYGSKIYKI